METEKYFFTGKQLGNLKIIYEDNHIISVIKPAGFLSQQDGSDLPDILSEIKKEIKIRDSKPGDVFLALIHRLDTNTAGCMVFGKTSKGASRISEELRSKMFYKGYFAVISGKISKNSGFLHNNLLKDEKNNKVYEDKNGKECLLYYEKISETNDKTLVCAYPITGRTHQIRAQFSLCGHPLCGDIKYGGGKSDDNFSLWSCVCAFKHPTKDVNLMFLSVPDTRGYFKEFSEEIYLEYINSLTFDKLREIKAPKG